MRTPPITYTARFVLLDWAFFPQSFVLVTVFPFALLGPSVFSLALPCLLSINKAQVAKCFWMAASCWQDLSGLFIEELVSCYHWDGVACGNSGEKRPLMPSPLCSSVLLLLSLTELCEMFVSDRRAMYRHPHARTQTRGAELNEHAWGPYRLKPDTFISGHTCTISVIPPLQVLFFGPHLSEHCYLSASNVNYESILWT